ncbi:MAG: hypothetical protein HPY50_07130 [Firmicutes bacterium]|nr:hypothetical protein [Bacillota bacterium]
MKSMPAPKKHYIVRENNGLTGYGENHKRLESINRIAAGVAHEIRNSLTEVFGFIQLLELSVEPNQAQKRYLENIYSGVESINSVINELLLLQASLNLRTRPITVMVLIEEMMDRVKQRAHDQSTTLAYKQFGPLPLVEVDQSLIGRALYNLIKNALDAVEQGGEVSVAARYQSGRKTVVIEISDTGKGIAKESLNLIFEPFYSCKPLGTGLGLCSALNVVKQHGGDIKVNSCEGEGSTFLVELPAIGFEST